MAPKPYNQSLTSLNKDFSEKCDSKICKLSVFASICAISVLVLYGINFYGDNKEIKELLRDIVHLEIKEYVNRIVEKEIRDTVLKFRAEVYSTYKKNFHREKRNAMLKTSSIQEDNTVAPSVEFFNPKMRAELEERDAVEMKKTGAKGAAPGGDTWVWLTSYSRVPFKVVQRFCMATQDYCPPGVEGPKGPPGQPGPKGDRGDMGLPGFPGLMGGKGPVGPPGPKGEQGFPGNPGLDGREGVPGEPGLDGMAGRNGADGAPGLDGIPGKDGSPGKNGKDGKDGKIGVQGPQGPKGLKGDKGSSGPKGQRGNDGRDGIPGKPGLSIYNYTKENELFIPPTFAMDHARIIVRERETLRLSCNPMGQPEPTVEWRKADSTAIIQGPWRDNLVSSHVLNILNISRWHAGKYICFANNGMMPPANQTVDVEVHFSPFIKVQSNVVYVYNKSMAKLECEVEAWPEPVFAWESEGVTLEGLRYRTEVTSTAVPWRWILKLEIPGIREYDMRQYSCVAKNELKNKTVKGHIQLMSPLPNQALIPVTYPMEFGIGAPETTMAYEQLCKVTTCPTCPKCDRTQPLITIMTPKLDKPKRNSNCQLYAIGKPVYHTSKDELFGAWMRDPSSKDHQTEKLWTTEQNSADKLREYRSKSNFKADRVDEFHILQRLFYGNGHVIYDGAFYYQGNVSKNPGEIIRYDLTTRSFKSLRLPNVVGRLYTAQYNQVDFSTDDNGVWAIYPIVKPNNTAVAKLSFDVKTDELKYDYIWNVSIDHTQVGEMFIVCGVLYVLDSTTEKESKVSVAVDLFLNKTVEVSLPFTNPFRKTTQLGYDHNHKELYSWDRGNQLTYPVRSNDLAAT